MAAIITASARRNWRRTPTANTVDLTVEYFSWFAHNGSPRSVTSCRASVAHPRCSPLGSDEPAASTAPAPSTSCRGRGPLPSGRRLRFPRRRPLQPQGAQRRCRNGPRALVGCGLYCFNGSLGAFVEQIVPLRRRIDSRGPGRRPGDAAPGRGEPRAAPGKRRAAAIRRVDLPARRRRFPSHRRARPRRSAGPRRESSAVRVRAARVDASGDPNGLKIVARRMAKARFSDRRVSAGDPSSPMPPPARARLRPPLPASRPTRATCCTSRTSSVATGRCRVRR